MTALSKWNGLLNETGTDTDHQAAPAPRRGPTIIALTLLALIVAGSVFLLWTYWQATPAQPPASTQGNPLTSTVTPVPEATTQTPPEPAPTASADVFAPAERAAEAWLHAFMDDRAADTPWANMEEAIAPYTAKPLAVYLVNTPEAQTAGVTPGTRLVSVDFSQIEADPDHPSTWSATVSYTRSDTTTGTGRITLEPAQGGWRVTRWSTQ